MGSLRTRALATVVALAMLTGATSPQWRDWDYDFDQDVKPWKEIEAKIPGYPKPESLLPFEAGAPAEHHYFIDAPSVSIGEDRVVRYTLVVKAAGGATNVTFEGMRCETNEQKIYAVGRANGNWVRARKPQWRRVGYQNVNRHHGVLYKDFLCSGRLPVASEREVLQRLKYGAPARDSE